jgi:hypothetical protein
VKLFRHGELGRAILDALRKAEGKPQHVSKIVSAVIPAMMHRVRANLAYLWRERRSVTKTGERYEARWALKPEPLPAVSSVQETAALPRLNQSSSGW